MKWIKLKLDFTFQKKTIFKNRICSDFLGPLKSNLILQCYAFTYKNTGQRGSRSSAFCTLNITYHNILKYNQSTYNQYFHLLQNSFLNFPGIVEWIVLKVTKLCILYHIKNNLKDN